MSTLPKLALIPSGYKASKVYSALPTNGDGDFTFSRISNATRVNKDGLIETIDSNVPRLDYSDSNCPSLLLEPQRTNLIRHSEVFTNWINTGTAFVSSNDNVSPDGTLNASTVSGLTGSGSNNLYFITGENPASKTYTFSVYLKGEGTLRLQISNDVDQAISETVTLTSDWKRYIVTGTFNSTLGDLSVVIDDSNANATEYKVWGAQLEEGNYATSYIPTNGEVGGVTRTVETCKKENQTIFTDYPFTVYAKAKIDAVGNTIFSLNNTSSQNYYLVFYLPTSTQVGLLRRDLSNNDSDFYNFSYSVGDTIKVAAAFVSSTAYKLYINGTEIANVTSGDSIPFNHDDISLGQFRITGDTGTRDPINEFMIFNEVLSDAELISLTT